HLERLKNCEVLLKCLTIRARQSCTLAIRIGDPLDLIIEFKSARLIKPAVGIAIKDYLNQPLIPANTKFMPSFRVDSPVSSGQIRCSFEALPLLPGRYWIDLYMGDQYSDYDVIINDAGFDV